jgi:hypothetical protein
MRSQLIIASTILVTVLLAPAPFASAQFFASLPASGDTLEGNRASAAALLGFSQVLSAVSNLEGGNASAADHDFDAAHQSFADAVAMFDRLGRGPLGQKKIDLGVLHPDERTFLNDPGLLALGNKRLDTTGDIFALTAGALSVALKNIESLKEKRSPEAYAVVRDDFALLLRIGQVATTLLASAK